MSLEKGIEPLHSLEFSIAIDETDSSTDTAVALDQYGRKITSLKFNNIEHLLSEEFYQLMKQHVAATLAGDLSGVATVENINDDDFPEDDFHALFHSLSLEMNNHMTSEKRTLQYLENWGSGGYHGEEWDKNFTASETINLARRLHQRIEEDSELARKLQLEEEYHALSHNSGRSSTNAFLDSIDDEAVLARQKAKEYLTGRAITLHKRSNGDVVMTSSGITMGQGNYTKNCGRHEDLTRLKKERRSEDDDYDGSDDEDDHCREYTKKSMRKLVIDMIEAGWMHVEDHGKGHHFYIRYVEASTTKKKHKQTLVLPCTPSSRRTIDRIRARLKMLDRQAVEYRNNGKMIVLAK